MTLNYPCEYNRSQVQLYVVDRSTGEVLKTMYMSADSFYCFHHVNAYEDKGNCSMVVNNEYSHRIKFCKIKDSIISPDE